MATFSTNCGLAICEATKLITDRDLMVYISHAVSGILNSKEGLWLSGSCLLKYQSLLLERPITQLKNCSALNPVTFLPESLDKKQNHVLALNLVKEMATHSIILAWRIPWTEEPGGLLSIGLHRVGRD